MTFGILGQVTDGIPPGFPVGRLVPGWAILPYGELLDKYGDSDEAQERIAQEMGWDRGGAADNDTRMSIEEINAICEGAAHETPPEPDPHREGIDWIRTKDGELRHPLQHRCFESGMKFWRDVKALGWEPLTDKDLDEFVFEFRTTAAKLAGALASCARGCGCRYHAFTVAYLKRALDHLHRAQASLEAAAPKCLLPAPLMTDARQELFAIREGILRLMDESRRRLQ